MKESKATTYTLTERYMRKMYKDIILNELITFVFYFVFNILFKDHPNYAALKHFLAFVFMLIAIALLYFGKKRADRVASIHYEVQKKGLAYFDGRKTKLYAWSNFKEVKCNRNRISLIYPYEFYTEEGVFVLHRQLDKPDELIAEILKKTNLEVTGDK